METPPVHGGMVWGLFTFVRRPIHFPGRRKLGRIMLWRTKRKWNGSDRGRPSNSFDYYGVDQKWYFGGSWVRPIFDGGYSASTLLSIQASYITIDNLELRHVNFATASNGPGIIAAGNQTNLVIQNCFVHGWQTTASADSIHGGVIFMYSGGGVFGTGNILNNCIITNAENTGSEKPCGVAVRAWQTIENCIIHDVSSAVLFTGNIHNCTLYNISYPIGNADFDRSSGATGIYLDNSGYASNTVFCFDNYIYNTGTNAIYPNPHGQTQYIYNNVVYGVQSTQLAIEIDPYEYGSEGGGTCYVYNNTIVNYNDGAPGIHVVIRPNRLNLLSIVNNQVIYPTSGALSDAVIGNNVSILTESNNVVESVATATAQGYTMENLYAPINASDPTVGAGIPEATVFTTDILGVSRTLQAAWDIGAYQYVAAAPSAASALRSVAPGSGSVISSLSYVDAGNGALEGSGVSSQESSDTSIAASVAIPSISNAPSSWLAYVSAQAEIVGNADILTAGFVTSGNKIKSLLIRGVGPSLSGRRVVNVLNHPKLTLFDSNGNAIASATSWNPNLSAEFSEVGAFALLPNSNDAALVDSVSPGVHTAEISSSSSDSGVALLEIYDINPEDESSRIVNFSARACIGKGTDGLTGGFAVGGDRLETLLIRAIGPSLAGLGAENCLRDPVLTISDASGQTVCSTTGWGNNSIITAGPGMSTENGESDAPATSEKFIEVGAFSLIPDSADAALIISLPAGLYTAHVSGVNGETGVAMLEIYEIK